MPPRRIKKQRNEYSTSVPELQGTESKLQVSDAGTRRVRKSGPTLQQKARNSTATSNSEHDLVEGGLKASIIESGGEDRPVQIATSGLASLPPELLSEVLSYLPQIQVPFQRNLLRPFCDDESGLERLVLLRALSQTCRSLRSFALPLCWETIEAVSCDSETLKYGSKWGEALATDLIRQLEIVTVRDPSLAQYVKVVTVLMTPWCISGVTKELARCLGRFPNPHTLQILGNLSPEYQTKFRAFFSKVKLPGVRTLAIYVPTAMPVVNACPNLIKLAPFVPSTSYYMSQYNFRVQDMGNFPYLEQLRHVQLQDPDILRDAIQKFPRLKIIDLITSPSLCSDLGQIPDCLELMRQLENLHCIRLHYGWIDYSSTCIPPQILETAEAVLRNSPRPVSGSHKCVIQVHSGKPEMHCLILGKETPGEYCSYARENVKPMKVFRT